MNAPSPSPSQESPLSSAASDDDIMTDDFDDREKEGTGAEPGRRTVRVKTHHRTPESNRRAFTERPEEDGSVNNEDEHNDAVDLSSSVSLPVFTVGQTVYVLEQGSNDKTDDTPQIYPAVVRQVQHDDLSHKTNEQRKPSGWRYLVHYRGWNARFDKWQQGKDLRQDCPEFEARWTAQEKRKEEDRGEEEATAFDSGSKQQKEPETPRKRKNLSNELRERKQHRATLPATANNLPLTLYIRLHNDEDLITRQGWTSLHERDLVPKSPARVLHDLPASVSVRKLLTRFAAAHPEAAAWAEELSELFAVALPKCLLYEEERPQYRKLSGTDVRDTYGSIHLLRLASRLLSTMVERDSRNVYELLIFLQKLKQDCSYRTVRQGELLPWEEAIYATKNS